MSKIQKSSIHKFLPKVLIAIIFIALTKINFSIIIGTEMRFSASAMFGPTISSFFGEVLGSSIIALSYLMGLVFGIYKAGSFISWLTFLPIITAGLYFSKILKGERKIIIIPILSILLFLAHPIGREVWYYSLFWLIPVLIVIFRPMLSKFFSKELLKVYSFALGTTFVDHSVGSIMYLYSMSIPAKFWIAAIPFTIIERVMIAGGITLSYYVIKMFVYLYKKFEKKIEIIPIKEKQSGVIETNIKK